MKKKQKKYTPPQQYSTIVKATAKDLGLDYKEAKKVVDGFLKIVKKKLSGEIGCELKSFFIEGFGAFEAGRRFKSAWQRKVFMNKIFNKKMEQEKLEYEENKKNKK